MKEFEPIVTSLHSQRKLSIILLYFSILLSACEKALDVEELTIDQIHNMMESGEVTAEELVKSYLARIQAYDKDGPYINSIITINPNAVDQARALDLQRWDLW